MYDLIIIGGGPCGLTAGIYSGRAGLKTLLIEKAMPGGQAANTHLIENYPGFPDGIGGWDLMELFTTQAKKWGTVIITDTVTALTTKDNYPIVVCGDKQYEAKTVLVATGASPKHMGAAGEESHIGTGVSYCGTCDGPLYRDKAVVVVGGGNTALQEIDFLSRFVKKLHLIHRGNSFRAQQPLVAKVNANPKVEIHLNAEVKEIFGDPMVSSVKVVEKGEEKNIATDGVFIFVGHAPNADFCRGFLELDDRGFVKVSSRMQTSQPGFFAAGDVISKDFFQVATAVGEGAEAVHGIELWLQQK